MAKVRIGFSTAFELENELVGIGTDNPTNTLQALANIKSSDSKVVGVTTLTTYQGFVDTKLSLQGSAGAKQHTTSGEIIIEGTVNVSTGTTFTSGPENLTVTNKFTLPKKTTYAPTVGSTRFNENLAALEFYTGSEWRAVNSYVDMGNRGRAVIYQGYQPSYYPGEIDFLQITTLGNTQSFGDQHGSAARDRHGCGSDIRGVFGGGISPGGGRFDSMEYVTLSSEGNAADFGDLTQGEGHGTSCSSSTRGLFGGGYQPTLNNTVNYIQIQTLGDALDFGDLFLATGYLGSGASLTRAIFCGGSYNAPNDLASDRTEFFTFASTGNGTDFGGLTNGRFRPTSCGANLSVFTFGSMTGNSGQVRGIDQTNTNSLGRSLEFGDLSFGDFISGFAAGNNTRVVVGSGQGAGTSPAFQQNRIEYITIATSGNSQDFGDATLPTAFANATSDSHGGLGGF